MLYILKQIKPYTKHVRTILEPSCGTGQFLVEVDTQFYDVHITGYEKNKAVFQSLESLSFKNKVTLVQGDVLKKHNGTTYDLIIGNPPFFVMDKNKVNSQYHAYFSGRPNIFAIFVIFSLHRLNENGVISARR